MSERNAIESFTATAAAVGAVVVSCATAGAAAAHIAAACQGEVLLPACPSLERLGLAALLAEAGVMLADGIGREEAATAVAGVTGANFAIAETGTLVLESTAEEIRLATTLPEKHFVLLDPGKIVADSVAAVPHLRAFHRADEPAYLAYITGPSRTADIERVLTIGVHGPKELHILVLEGLSSDPMEI